MVKIKEGYVMSPSEKAEYDSVDALPRKSAGRVDYYFKPQTKYPPRIYVFMHAEMWCDRNRRPMGLAFAFPFLTRQMNKGEIEYHHFDIRLCYHQYEDWDKLLFAEEKEASELNTEFPGKGSEFLIRLKSLKEKYPIGSTKKSKPPECPQTEVSDETKMLRDLIALGGNLTALDISKMLDEEQCGLKRKSVLILIRQLYKNTVLPDAEKIFLNEEQIGKKVRVAEERTRRNFVRRIYRKNKLFAMEEIRLKYPDYTEEMLWKNLPFKKASKRKKKRNPVLDLRRCQLIKLAHRLQRGVLTEMDYQQTCNRFAMLNHAHSLRLPIPLAVTLNKEVKVYSFAWRTRENVVKFFAELANSGSVTHEELTLKYHEITGSSYSY